MPRRLKCGVSSLAYARTQACPFHFIPYSSPTSRGTHTHTHTEESAQLALSPPHSSLKSPLLFAAAAAAATLQFPVDLTHSNPVAICPFRDKERKEKKKKAGCFRTRGLSGLRLGLTKWPPSRFHTKVPCKWIQSSLLPGGT